jgi:sec-independent protein translocase protein TatA
MVQKMFRISAWYNCRALGLRHPRRPRYATAEQARRVKDEQGDDMGKLGVPELVIILVIVILIFGANRLPEIGRGIGKGIRNFKDANKNDEKDKDDPKSGTRV